MELDLLSPYVAFQGHEQNAMTFSEYSAQFSVHSPISWERMELL